MSGGRARCGARHLGRPAEATRTAADATRAATRTAARTATDAAGARGGPFGGATGEPPEVEAVPVVVLFLGAHNGPQIPRQPP
ncbi:hypothetical protein ATKI12_1471 [Kitasatospora sp. Ki12]